MSPSKSTDGSRSFTPRTIQLMRRKYEAGASLRDLGREFHAPFTTIGNVLRSSGVQMRPMGFTPATYERARRIRNDRKMMERLMSPSAFTPEPQQFSSHREYAREQQRLKALQVPPSERTLTQARLAAGITQKEISERLGVHSGHYSRLENGERPLNQHEGPLHEMLGEFVAPPRTSEHRKRQARIAANAAVRAQSTREFLLRQEAEASIAIDADPRMQTHSVGDEFEIQGFDKEPGDLLGAPEEECIDYLSKPDHEPHLWTMPPPGKGERRCPGKGNPEPPDDYPVGLAETVEGGVHTYTTYGQLKEDGSALAEVVRSTYRPGAQAMAGPVTNVEDGNRDPKTFTVSEVKAVIDQVQAEIDETSDEAIAEIIRQAQIDKATAVMVAREGAEAETVTRIVEWLRGQAENRSQQSTYRSAYRWAADEIDSGAWHKPIEPVSNPELWR